MLENQISVGNLGKKVRKNNKKKIKRNEPTNYDRERVVYEKRPLVHIFSSSRRTHYATELFFHNLC